MKTDVHGSSASSDTEGQKNQPAMCWHTSQALQENVVSKTYNLLNCQLKDTTLVNRMTSSRTAR